MEDMVSNVKKLNEALISCIHSTNIDVVVSYEDYPKTSRIHYETSNVIQTTTYRGILNENIVCFSVSAAGTGL